MNVLVIGVGNKFRGDDAVGLLVVRRLAERNLPGITIIEQSGEGSDLLMAWEGQESVLLIDAARSGTEPGTIHRFEANEASLPVDCFSFSSHAFGVAGAIEIARMLEALPELVVVYGIEGENFTAGLGLSQPVERSLEIITLRLVDEIREISNIKNSSIK